MPQMPQMPHASDLGHSSLQIWPQTSAKSWNLPPRYHIGIASCQLALLIEARSRGGAVLPASERELYETWLNISSHQASPIDLDMA